MRHNTHTSHIHIHIEMVFRVYALDGGDLCISLVGDINTTRKASVAPGSVQINFKLTISYAVGRALSVRRMSSLQIGKRNFIYCLNLFLCLFARAGPPSSVELCAKRGDQRWESLYAYLVSFRFKYRSDHVNGFNADININLYYCILCWQKRNIFISIFLHWKFKLYILQKIDFSFYANRIRYYVCKVCNIRLLIKIIELWYGYRFLNIWFFFFFFIFYQFKKNAINKYATIFNLHSAVESPGWLFEI